MTFKKSFNIKSKSMLIFIISLTGFYWLTSCKDEPFEYKIDRVPAFTFRLDTFDIVNTTDVSFYLGPSILHEFEDSTQAIYQRISLEAGGMTPKSNNYLFIIDFDTHQAEDNVGTYRSLYDLETGGINDMRLIIEYDGDLLEFSAVREMDAVYFQVVAQREEERIMKGTFGGILYKDGNPANQAVIISNGVFQDINY